MEDNKKLFENSTTYTKESYIEFLEFHGRKYNFTYHLYTIFWSFLLILCMILSFGSGSRIQGVIITIILVSFIIYRIMRPKMIISKELQSEKVSDNNTNTFSFYDKNFNIENKNGKFTYRYFMLRKVFSTPNYFYLYVTKENAFLISKSAFSLGDEKSFDAFIKSKCSLKYKKIGR